MSMQRDGKLFWLNLVSFIIDGCVGSVPLCAFGKIKDKQRMIEGDRKGRARQVYWYRGRLVQERVECCRLGCSLGSGHSIL